MSWDKLKCYIERSDQIILFPHISADGDAIGSVCAFAHGLKSMGKKVYILLDEKPERKLRFLLERATDAGIQWGIYSEDILLPREPDLCIAVDSAEEKRLGDRKEIFYLAKERAGIDHHDTGMACAPLWICNPAWAATAEGIWEMFDTWGWDKVFAGDDTGRKNASVALYTGILTDTGGFANSNVTEYTFSVMSKLVGYVDDPAALYAHLLTSVSPQQVKLRAELYSRIEYFYNGRIAYALVDEETFERTGTTQEDAGEFVSMMRNIENVNVAVFAKPCIKTGNIRISLRSDECCDVAKIAQELGGGGHKRAAGLTYNVTEADSDFAEYKKMLLEKIGGSLI